MANSRALAVRRQILKYKETKIIINWIASFIVALSDFHEKRNKREGIILSIRRRKKAVQKAMGGDVKRHWNHHNSLPNGARPPTFHSQQ